MSRRWSALLVAVVTLGLAHAAPQASSDGVWLAGDLHVHTTYSHDSWDPIADDEESEPWTLGHSVANQFAIAASRGLDFLAITDHNDIRAQTDPGYGSMGVLPIDGYENSLSGHAQMLGAASCYAPDGPFEGVQGCNDWEDRSAARVEAMADALRADGGVFQVNHPAGDSVDFPHDADWGYGHEVVPDTVEVWNIQSLWQPPFPSSNSIDDAIAYWEGFLNMGHRVAATGGSDNHWVSTTAVQGVGQPTTWVYVAERSRDAILEGLRLGRTTISWQPPAYGGPRLMLEADADGDGEFESMVGDEVPVGATVRATVADAPAAARIEIFTNEGALGFESGPPGAGVEFEVEPGTMWVRAELLAPDHIGTPLADGCEGVVGGETTYCRNRLLRLAMTSAIYVG